MEQKYKFGLIKDDGVWNNPTTNIYYNCTFTGYKPIQSSEIFGLINSTDGNFWLLSEDDDHYWTTTKISEQTIRDLYNKLKNNDFSDNNIFNFKDYNIIELNLTSLHNNKISKNTFHKDWIPALIKTLDIDNPIKSEKEILPIWEKSLVPDKIKYPMMTPKEYIYSKVQSTSYYTNEDFEVTKFSIYDDLFNSLNSHDEVENFLDLISKTKEINYDRVERLLKEPTYNGYTKFKEFKVGDIIRIIPNFNSLVIEDILEDEKQNYPDVIFWQTNSNKNLNKIMNEKNGLIINTKFNPYPNFKKEYSVLWLNKDELFEKLSIEWIKEIIWFYQKSLEAIENGCFKYNLEFPTGFEKEDLKRVEECKKIFQNKTNEEITKNYECEYNGNIPKFLSKKWIEIKKEYINFINEIIEIANKSLENKENNFIQR